MEKLNVIQAQSMKIVQPNGNYGYLPDAVNALAQHFEFKGLPKEDEVIAAQKPVDPNTPAKPLSFTQGKITLDDRLIVVDSFQIYPLGLLVSTRTNTDDSDRVILHVLEWASETFPITYDELKPSFGHWSTLDFKFERPLPDMFPTLKRIAELIKTKLEPFWDRPPDFELTAVGFFYEKEKFPAFAPPTFRIDRRAGQPFERNIYWSEAPLSTDNHIALLSEFEGLCT